MAETENNKTPHVLAVGSYAVHGTASLKTFIKILGSAILPVPSLVLSGLTNLAGVKKFELPFEELLESVLELAVLRGQQLLFYTGYLGNPQQAAIVIKLIEKYRPIIKTIITDPVCGDNGCTYVPQDVIAMWPDIIKLSDIVSPNLTELKLITGYPVDDEAPIDVYIDQFKKLYPDTKLLVSSYVNDNDDTGVQLYDGASTYTYCLPTLAQNFGGSGDLLLALFIRHHFYSNLAITDALQTATWQTHQVMQYSIANKSAELLLNEEIYNRLMPLN